MEKQTVNNNDEVEIDLGEVFHLLLSKLGVIILSGIVFCLAAVMGTMLLITPKYESTTKIVVLSKQDSSTLTNQDITDKGLCGADQEPYSYRGCDRTAEPGYDT